MKKLLKIDTSKLFLTLVISFFLMSIWFFLKDGIERNYFSISSLTLVELKSQVLVFLIVFVILFLVSFKLSKPLLSAIFSLVYLAFICLFVINSPVFSLVLGGLIISVPILILSLSTVIKNIKSNRDVTFWLSSLALLVFVFLIVFTLMSINMEPLDYSGVNTSLISDSSILNEWRLDFFRASVLVGLTLLVVSVLFGRSGLGKSLFKYEKYLWIIVGGLVLFQVVSFSVMMVYRVKAFDTPTYDFGIFTQMFYSMKNNLTMVTTLERSIPMSHLLVHFSPIYYLILPIFRVFPFPETLQVVPIIIVALGVVPVYLIGKHFKLSNLIIAISMIVYVFHPALISSSFYDLHENAFLPPLLLFLFYFMIRQDVGLTLIFLVLTLFVKEDSAVYTFVLGLYFLVGYKNELSDKKAKDRNLILSLLVIGLSVGYFIFVLRYLETFGEQAMFWRYDNLNAYRDLNTIGIIYTVFQNPSYLLATMFSPDKIYSLVIVLFSLGMIPLFSKKFETYLLLIPLVVFNLASAYNYQHQFGYQYYFGSTTFLIIMMLLVLKDRNQEKEVFARFDIQKVLFMVLALVVVTVNGSIWIDTKSYNVDYFAYHKDVYIETKAFLVGIDSDKRVCATGYLTTYLANREVLYDLDFINLDTTDIEFDYVIIDMRLPEDRILRYQIKLARNGYVISELSNDFITVYVNNNID